MNHREDLTLLAESIKLPPTTSPSTEPGETVNKVMPIDLASVFTFLGDAPATPPRELIKKFLPACGVAVTGGQSGAGKTFVEIHKAVCLATSLPFFGPLQTQKEDGS